MTSFRPLLIALTLVLVGGACHDIDDPGPPQYQGVNLAGADFGETVLPGTFGIHYTYPTRDEVDFFVDAGMNIFRLPFRWERLQPIAFGEFDPAELARLDDFVTYATSRDATVVLDPHNYARYYGDVIGQGVPVAAFADFWSRLAALYRNDDSVIFGLMNEPNDLPTELWVDDANAAIAAIRAADADNLVLVPGNQYTGAFSWSADWYGTPNSEAMLDISDPADNYAIEVHQYLNEDSSGATGDCVDEGVGARRLLEFNAWLHLHDLRGFLGEFGVGDNPTCLAALDAMLDIIDINNDVWLGWTYWAAGPWWGDYILEIEPTNGVSDDGQFDVLEDHLG